MKTPRILTTTIALLLTPAAFAFTDTWDGNLPNAGAGDSLLSNGLNWADNTAPLSDLVNTDLIFAGTTKLAPIVGTALSTNSVVFNNTAGAFTINGTVLTVGSGGITNNDANTQTFGNVVNFGLATTATVNAASGPLTFINQITAPIDLTVDGAFATSFFNVQAGASILKQGTGTMSWGSTVATAADVTVAAGTMTLSGPTTFSSGSTIAVNGTSTLNIGQNVTLNGGQFTRASGATLAIAAGETLTVQNGGDAILTGSFSNTTASTIAVTGAGSTFSTTSTLSFLGGSTLTVAAGGDVSSGTGSISVGASGGNGTVSVDGSGSSFGGGNLNVGLIGSTGLLTFSNGSTGAFGSIGVNNSATAATSGTLNIQTGATVTGTSLFLAPSAAANSGMVTINGAGSALTLTGAAAATIGATSLSTGALNVQSGGAFTSGTGTTTVNATGTVAITGGTFNANGNMTLNGQMTRDAASVFNLAAGRTLTIQGGGDFQNSGAYSHTTASTVTVTGAGSTLTASGSNQLRFSGGSTLNVLAGGQVSSGGSIVLAGDVGNATVLVDGAGSLLASTVFGATIATSGNTAALTFSNGAAGSFVTSMFLSSSNIAGTNATVSVLSGATVSAGGLTMANAVGASTATLTIDGAGSAITLTGGTSSNIGAASASSAQISIDHGGVFTTNTATFTLNATGAVNLVDGDFNANGSVTLNGGNFNAGLNGEFALAANRTLTVTNGGDASFANLFFLTQTNARVTVSGGGSTLTGGSFLTTSSNVVTVNNAGSVTFANILLGSGSPATTTSVTGAGSSMTATGSFEIGQGTHTFSLGATGSLGAVLIDAEPSALSGVTGNLVVQSGAAVTSENLRIADTGLGGGNANALTVTGVGSSYTQTGNSTTSLGFINAPGTPSTGTLNVVDGGTYTSGTGLIFLNTSGTLNIDGGTLDLKGGLVRNGGALNFNTGALKIIDPLTIGTGGLLGVSVTLDVTRRLATTATTTIDPFRTLTLNGGSFSTGALVNNGTLDFQQGALAITGAGGFNIGTGALGANVTLGTGATLQVSQTTTINAGALLRLNGGVFTSANVTNNGTLDQQDGTLNITGTLNNAAGSRLFVGGLSFDTSNVTNAGRITLQNGLGQIGGTGTITNTGVITGDGAIGKAVTNAASGQLRAEAGKTLLLTGAVAANAGTYSLEGGTLEFANAITNGATGTITGFGALRSALLTNSGNIGLSGDARFYGDVTNAAGARIITSGGSTTTFYDDVIHNGTEIRTSAGGASVFFGAVSGAGPFTGTGTVYFEGDLRPGNSPASVLYEGDLVFGGGSSLIMEIGGLLSGSQYDHLNVGGALHADGDLVLALLDGFTPQLGDTFDLFDVGTLAGDFDSISAPALGGGNAWDFSALKTTGSVTVVPEPGIGALLLTALGLLGGRGRFRGARASRVLVEPALSREGASRRNELPDAPDSENVCAFPHVRKVREGGTPSPALGTSALPGTFRAAAL